MYVCKFAKWTDTRLIKSWEMMWKVFNRIDLQPHYESRKIQSSTKYVNDNLTSELKNDNYRAIRREDAIEGLSFVVRDLNI